MSTFKKKSEPGITASCAAGSNFPVNIFVFFKTHSVTGVCIDMTGTGNDKVVSMLFLHKRLFLVQKVRIPEKQ